MKIAGCLGTAYKRKTEYKDSHKCCECRCLWPRSHKASDRRRSTFIYVGRPNVERGHRDLEAKSDDHHGTAGEKQGREVRCRHLGGDLREVRRSCRTIGKSHAV